jgi:hypothetical protein
MGQGVTGRACNECLEKFYSFSKKYGKLVWQIKHYIVFNMVTLALARYMGI